MNREEFEIELKKINREANNKIVALIMKMESPPSTFGGGFNATFITPNNSDRKIDNIHQVALSDK